MVDARKTVNTEAHFPEVQVFLVLLINLLVRCLEGLDSFCAMDDGKAHGRDSAESFANQTHNRTATVTAVTIATHLTFHSDQNGFSAVISNR